MLKKFHVQPDASTSLEGFLSESVGLTSPPLGGDELNGIESFVHAILQIGIPLFLRGFQGAIPGSAGGIEKGCAIAVGQMIGSGRTYDCTMRIHIMMTGIPCAFKGARHLMQSRILLIRTFGDIRPGAHLIRHKPHPPGGAAVPETPDVLLPTCGRGKMDDE